MLSKSKTLDCGHAVMCFFWAFHNILTDTNDVHREDRTLDVLPINGDQEPSLSAGSRYAKPWLKFRAMSNSAPGIASMNVVAVRSPFSVAYSASGWQFTRTVTAAPGRQSARILGDALW